MDDVKGTVLKPKWQRARFLEGGCYPEVKGHEIWVESESLSNNICGCLWSCSKRAMLMNTYRDTPNWRDCIHLESVELLPEFADDVPVIHWEQYAAECRRANAVERGR
jgi:hypothetical protein